MVVGGVLRAQTSAHLSQSSSSHLHVREVDASSGKTMDATKAVQVREAGVRVLVLVGGCDLPPRP